MLMEIWHKRVTILYSITSKRDQISVNPIKIDPVIVLSLHNNISATVKEKKKEKKWQVIIKKEQKK